jgi:hypothetical protein
VTGSNQLIAFEAADEGLRAPVAEGSLAVQPFASPGPAATVSASTVCRKLQSWQKDAIA